MNLKTYFNTNKVILYKNLHFIDPLSDFLSESHRLSFFGLSLVLPVVGGSTDIYRSPCRSPSHM